MKLWAIVDIYEIVGDCGHLCNCERLWTSMKLWAIVGIYEIVGDYGHL